MKIKRKVYSLDWFQFHNFRPHKEQMRSRGLHVPIAAPHGQRKSHFNERVLNGPSILRWRFKVDSLVQKEGRNDCGFHDVWKNEWELNIHSILHNPIKETVQFALDLYQRSAQNKDLSFPDWNWSFSTRHRFQTRADCYVRAAKLVLSNSCSWTVVSAFGNSCQGGRDFIIVGGR